MHGLRRAHTAGKPRAKQRTSADSLTTSSAKYKVEAWCNSFEYAQPATSLQEILHSCSRGPAPLRLSQSWRQRMPEARTQRPAASPERKAEQLQAPLPCTVLLRSARYGTIPKLAVSLFGLPFSRFVLGRVTRTAAKKKAAKQKQNNHDLHQPFDRHDPAMHPHGTARSRHIFS